MDFILTIVFYIAIALAIVNSIAFFGRKTEGFFGKMLENNARAWRGGTGGKIFQVGLPLFLFLFFSWGTGILLGYVTLLGYLHAKRQPAPIEAV